MKILKGRGSSIFLLIPWISLLLPRTSAIRADLYLNKDKFGEFLRMDISEKGCTNVPLNWDNQAISLDTHGSCIKFYDLPYCRGKYVALQPYHGTFQDNLETLGFKQLISSASPCGPKVPTGRYYILNGADGSVLTVDKRNETVVARTSPFKPYITKNQQFQIDKISLADYEIIPRVHDDLNPLTFDMSLSTRQHPVRRTWKIESVYRGKYLIKNEWNNRCLYKSQSGKVEEHECVAWSPNQEWMFKSIKVQPFFPSKEQLNQKPLRPDEQFPFKPQQEVPLFSRPPAKIIPPGLPLHKNKKKKKTPDETESEEEYNKEQTFNKPYKYERPNPIVLNPREPFPPVQPRPIYPKGTFFLPPVGKDGKPDYSKPPVPHVRHPGSPPFPREPVVTDPKKPFWPSALFGTFGPTAPTTTTAAPKKKTSEEEDEEDEEKEEEDEEKDDPEEKDEEIEEKDDPEEKEEEVEERDEEDKEEPDEDKNESEDPAERDEDVSKEEAGSYEKDEEE